MKTLYLLIITTLSLCIFSTLPSYSMCVGTYEPHIQKDNGTDVEGYHTYQVSIGDNQTYPLKYKISSNAALENIGWQKENPDFSIVVREVSQGGNLTIQLPTKLLGPYSGGYTVAEGTMCAGIFGKTFPTPIQSNSNFTTVSFPLMNYDGAREIIMINGNHATQEFLSPLKQIMSGVMSKDVQCWKGLQLIFKSEDDSPACVKPDTAQKLIERGWAKITVTKATFDVIQSNTTQTNAMANLGNDTGITTIGNQAYYFETPNYSHDAYFNSPQISFHDVIFTLFPSGFRGGLPTNGCGGQYYWTNAKFSDGTSELLHIFVGSPQCSDSQLSTYFSTHTNPQAGLIFYDGKMKLLISVEEK